METEEKTKEFRFNRKSALLTYPNVTQNIDFTAFKDAMERIDKIKRLVVGREKHPTSGEYHFHAFVEWNGKVDLRGNSGRDRLKVQGFGVHVSKHRRGAEGKRYCYEYCTKDGDYWESDGFDLHVCSKNFVKERSDYVSWKYYRSVRLLKDPYPFELPSD